MVTRYFIVFLLCIIAAVAGKNNGEFADYLFEKGEYKWAFLEYERLLYSETDSAYLPIWYYRCGKSLMHSGRFHEAAERFAAIKRTDPFSDSSRVLAALCSISYGDYAAARTRLDSVNLDISEIAGAYLDMHANDYVAAHARLRKVSDTSPDAFRARALNQAITRMEQFRPKKYAPALLLSLLPGAGHLYSHNKGDAFMSFAVITTGVLITGYYHHFSSERRAIAAGTVTGLFYLGSIYGAALSVKIYNKKSRRKQHAVAQNILFGK